ncbi:tyrosinase family protein [Mesorhizobium amorphae]|uniref:tyrosinase family protein n=1 Tax=Mesorhizobium amorphae TaxID=71433 RepID=UPI003ECEDB4E
MQYMRKNVWELGDDWAAPILWYARGVAAMKSRALAEPTSWRFYGAIHGIDRSLWKQLGYLSSSDPLPNSANIKRFWQQCQHGSWYFLPWHRGYVLAFEANIRDAVIKLGGPKDWALPYWNYFKPKQFKLPPAFASPDWPDGKGNNPLFVPQRYGPNSDGKVYVPVGQINLDAMNDPDFTGVSSGGSPGFGGVDTGFEHGGTTHGGIETQPHDWVHGLVGGENPKPPHLPGLMSDPDTAGLDPIFWLHHANIDRLWQVWRQNPPAHIDPTDANWLKGPGNIGERIFSMPMPGDVPWDYTPAAMADLAKLDYNYDDLSPAEVGLVASLRLERLGASAAAANVTEGAMAMASGKNVELVGANRKALPISGDEASTSVQLDAGMRSKVSASLTEAATTGEPDRVFLNLENVRGLSDATAFHVYVALPKGADPAKYPERLAGSIALFGVRKASLTDEEHAGKGLTFVLEITKIVDALHLDNALDVSALDVRIVPVKPVPKKAKISIGRISIFRQGV